MRRRRFFIWFVAVGLIGACATSGGGVIDEGLGLGGKADDPSEPAAVVEAADEALYSDALRTELCQAISAAAEWSDFEERDAFDQGCLDHEFTVTERTRSTLFGHLDDGRAVTLGMKVRVDAAGRSFESRLDRIFVQDTFRFRWVASAPEVEDARDAYIEDIADEMGEYFWHEDMPGTFRTIAFEEMPQQVRTRAEQRVDAMNADIAGNEHGSPDDGAGIADELHFEILRGDEVVGYVVSVWFYYNDPLFDGGGSTLYMNILGDIVEEVEWWG